MESIIQGDFSFFLIARGWKFVLLISQLYLGNRLSGVSLGEAVCAKMKLILRLYVCVLGL